MRRGKGEEGEDLNEIIQLHDGLCLSPVCGASHHHHPGLHQDIQLPPGQSYYHLAPLNLKPYVGGSSHSLIFYYTIVI